MAIPPHPIRSWLLALGRLWGGGGFRRSEGEGREGHCMARIKYLRRHWYANVHNSPHTFRQEYTLSATLIQSRANRVFTCDIILLTVCKTKNTSSVCILRQLSVGHPFTYLETESLGMFFLKFRIWPFFPVLWQGATEQGRRMSSSKRKDWRRGLWTLWCKKSFTLIKQLRSDLICETLTFDHTSLILAEICFCVNGEPGWGRLSEWGVRRSCKTKSLFLGGCSARITWCP